MTLFMLYLMHLQYFAPKYDICVTSKKERIYVSMHILIFFVQSHFFNKISRCTRDNTIYIYELFCIFRNVEVENATCKMVPMSLAAKFKKVTFF
jgi:hypothetical protein